MERQQLKHIRNGVYLFFSLLPWIIVLASSNRGLDITDESFYLLSFSNLQDIKLSFTLFGVLGRPLYDISGGNIVTIRVLGVLLWFVVVCFTSFQTIRFVQRKLNTTSKIVDLIPYFALAVAGGASYYHWWLITPSYNYFALLGISLFLGGLWMWLDFDNLWMSLTGASFIGVSAGIILWAKATSALLLPVFPLLMLFIYRQHWRKLVSPIRLVSGVIGLCMSLSLPLWHGLNIQEIMRILQDGINYTQLRSSGYSDSTLGIFILGFSKIVDSIISNPYRFYLIVFLIVPLCMGFFVLRLFKHQNYQISRLSSYFLAVLWLLNLVAITILYVNRIGLWGLNMVIVTFACFLAGLSYTHIIHRQPYTYIWLWAILVFTLVYIFTLGTVNNLTNQTELGLYFIILSVAMGFWMFIKNNQIAPLGRIAVPTLQIILTIFMLHNATTPYRQPESIWDMSYQVMLRDGESTLLVGEETEQYIAELELLVGNGDTKAPIIDLTGQTPGATYILGREVIVFPWILGGASGSEDATQFLLNLADPSEIESAWILTVEENSVRSISHQVLNDVGLNFPVDYELIGTVRRPYEKEIQGLWRPKRQ